MALAKIGKTAAAAAVVGGIGFQILDSKLNIRADLKNAKQLMKGLAIIKYGKITTDFTMADIWAESVAKWGSSTFVIDTANGNKLTFQQVDDMSNKFAHWLLAQGIKRGDAVALFMENKPEFIAWWLALTKIGAQCAMINNSIKSKGLLHCVKAANSKGIIFDCDTEAAVHDIEAELEGCTRFFWGKASHEFQSVHELHADQLSSLSSDGSSFHAMRKGLKMTDNFGFIYTSGTTGLPKAANIMHVKFCSMGSLPMMSGLTAGDRLYTCLPIFHSAGGGIGVVGCILTGSTLVLAKKFSNSNFWTDIVKHECTGFQYIGELGRYLVNYYNEHAAELKPLIAKHKLKVAMGNGLRPEVWDEFQDGLRIPLIVEFYGATEGNGILINFCEREDKAARGAVGRAGALLGKMMPTKLVKFDVDTEECVRGADGLCIECAFGEPGELLFPNLQNDPGKAFKGYTDPKATAKKLLSDGFVKGDSWFRSGDLLSKDSLGYFYFVDRIGDTFRWKGENCSTMEVSQVVSAFEGVGEANAYGVKVPGVVDGRACMVAISPQPGVELQSQEKLDKLRALCMKELPTYAQPLFLRFLPETEVTATFKHQKVQLREAGCDPSKVSDNMFWLSPASKKYESFGAPEMQQLENGRSKL